MQFPQLFRAASKPSESWFNDSFGRPILDRFHCPPDGIGDLGRCNWAGDPVFYCSTENGVPVFEVRAAKDSFVVISNWADNRNYNAQIEFPISIKGVALGVKKMVAMLPDGDKFKELLLQDSIYHETTSELIKEVDDYIGDLFTSAASEVPRLYWFTSAISRAILNHMRHPETGKRLDSFIYPRGS